MCAFSTLIGYCWLSLATCKKPSPV